MDLDSLDPMIVIHIDWWKPSDLPHLLTKIVSHRKKIWILLSYILGQLRWFKRSFGENDALICIGIHTIHSYK